MSGYLILLAMFALLFSLSFFFGVREWLDPQDDKPLAVDVEYVRREDYFGVSFREKMQQWLQKARPVQATGLGEPVVGVLERDNGERLLLVRGGEFGSGREYDELICSEGDLSLPANALFRREIYAKGGVRTGDGVRLQSLASDSTIELGARSDVARWLDAVGKVYMGRNSVVHSRVCSRDCIELDHKVSVQALYAPLIFTAGYADFRNPLHEPTALVPERPNREAFLPNAIPLGGDTMLVRADLVLPQGSLVKSNLVVHGTLQTGPDCIFEADVKASSVRLGPRCVALGSVVSGSSAEVGDHSIVFRSVVAETDIALGCGVRVGKSSQLAVISAGREILLHADVAVCGKIAAGRAIVTS